MVRKRLVLHIGFNKTGSSYLQKCLHQNAPQLLSKGILYPCEQQVKYLQNSQHVPVAAALTGLPVYWLLKKYSGDFDGVMQPLMKHIEESNAQTVVLSSEAFGAIDVTQKEAQKIYDYFSNFDVDVIAYVRRQDDYILSFYQQEIKTGSVKPFNLDNSIDLKQNYFSKRVQIWRDVFGSDKVTVRPYDRKFWHGEDLFFDFVNQIGADIVGLERAPSENEGLDFRMVALMRHLNREINRMNPKAPWAKKQRLRGTILNMLAKEKLLPSKTEKMSLSDSQVEKIRQHFRQDNEQTFSGTSISADEFFSERTSGRADNTQFKQINRKALLGLVVRLAEKQLS
nr:hypothetical protein [uncultured Cohaesibacter sp.]